jgi:hypothetical protein
MREIRTEAQLAAPPERVWDVVSDFASYGQWNPFMPSVEGEARVGARLKLRVEPPGKRANGIPARVVDADAPRRLAWRAGLIGPWFFSATHILELTPRDGGTLFVNREEFRGLIAPILLRYMGSSLPAGYASMNEALRSRLASA